MSYPQWLPELFPVNRWNEALYRLFERDFRDS